MTTTAVHPFDLRIGQFIRFNPGPHPVEPVLHRSGNCGRIAAKTVSSVLIEQGLTQAGTKVLLLVANERITGVWIGPPRLPVRTLVPVRRQLFDGHRRGGLRSRIFRDPPAPLVPGSGGLHLDDDCTPCAS